MKKPKAKILSLINVKVTSQERKAMDRLAEKYAKGNLSAWLRHAARHYKPKRDEVIR